MVIQHNLSAMNTYRQTGINNRFVNKNLEKLSSGFRINRAADDAAGLAISEKMRGQIRGLAQAQNNVTDGISLIKTADGAMQIDHDLLQRIRELLVQGSNGTFDDIDRDNIQKEIDQLMLEIDDLSYRTDFNGIKVLQGSPIPQDPNNPMVWGSMPKWVDMTQGGYLTNDDFDVETAPGVIQSYTNTANGTADFSMLNSSNVKSLVGSGFYHTCCTCSQAYSIAFNNSGLNNASHDSSGNKVVNIDITGVTSGKDLVDRIVSVATPLFDHFTKISSDLRDPSGNTLLIYDERDGQSAGFGYGTFSAGIWFDGNPGLNSSIEKELYIQCGSNQSDKVQITLPAIDTTTLKISGEISAKTPELASSSIEKIDNAINLVSIERANLGAFQNRLEHTLKNLGNTHENLQAAESSIRDVDMAKEMMEFTKNNILAQAAQSMLSQANQLPQGVMNLLQ